MFFVTVAVTHFTSLLSPALPGRSWQVQHSRCGMLCAAGPFHTRVPSLLLGASLMSQPEVSFPQPPSGGVLLVLTDSKKGTFVMMCQLELRRTGKAQPEASKWKNLQVTQGGARTRSHHVPLCSDVVLKQSCQKVRA